MIIKLEIATVPATKAAIAIATSIAIAVIATYCEEKDIGVASVVTLAGVRHLGAPQARD